MSTKVRGQSVRQRIIFLVLLLVIPLVLLGIAGTLYYQNVIKQNIDSDNLGSAKTIAAMTPEYMNASQLYLKSIADRPLVIKAMEENDTAFLRTMADYADNTTRIKGVYFTDGKGLIIVSTPDYASSGGSDASQQPFVRDALQSGEPVIGDAIPGSGGMPVVPIGVPVLDENGTVLGTLVGNVDMDEFSKVILNATESNRQYVYMVNKTGHIMVHNNHEYMRNMLDYTSVPAVQQVMKGESGILENYNPIENMTRLAAYAPVGPLGWSVVVAVPLDVAYKPVWNATWMAGGIIAAFTIIITGLGLYVGNGISSPIISLSQIMKNMDETGEYRQHLPLARKDEIGELARSFDDMVIAIQHENLERRQAEETLRESEEKYRELVENANSIIIRWDVDGRILFFNEFAEQFFGYHEDEVVGKDVTVLVPDTDTAGRDLRAMIEDIKRYPERFVNNLNENILKNGERRWVMWTNKAVRDDLGNVKEILAVGNDVTELRHAEEAREQLLAELKARTAELQDVNEEVEVKNEELAAQTEELECTNEELKTHNEELQSVSKSLRETQDYLENLISYANAPIIVWDPGFIITRFNQAFERLSGYTAGEVIGHNLVLLFPPDSKDESLEKIKKTLEGEQWESVEIPIRHKYGSIRIALWNSANIYDDNHNLTATIAQGQDITRRKQAETDLEEAKSQAELYLDLMGHDISNMHQIIMMQLELATDILDLSGKLEGDDRELIDSSLRTLNKASRLINNVRKLQKHQAGIYIHEPVDLTDVLNDILKDYSDLPGKDITIKFNPDGRNLVHANPLLKDVFSNIVDNAVKHSGSPLTIAVNVSKVSRNGGSYYRVAIEDNGNGIPDDRKDEVFHRFRRGQTKARGTGLGLYIVKTLVESFGGYVEAQNRVLDDYRQGTRFLVYLPAAEEGHAGNG